MLNNNMSCFEIRWRSVLMSGTLWLNNNMRCFEISVTFSNAKAE